MMKILAGICEIYWEDVNNTTEDNILVGLTVGNEYELDEELGYFYDSRGVKRTTCAFEWKERHPAKLPPEMRLSNDSDVRKNMPIFSGVLNYFPLAIAEISKLSKIGNDKHNPGQALHWAKEKSTDHKDCIARHLIDAGTIDPDSKLFHDVGLAWRALANLETLLEAQNDTK
jgi:hypothetical protein